MEAIAAKVSPKGQLTVPKAVRDALGIKGGSTVYFRLEDEHATFARAKTLLDVPVTDDGRSRAAPRLPWDANRRSRMQSRGKPQHARPFTPSPEPTTELTVDLRAAEPAAASSASDDFST